MAQLPACKLDERLDSGRHASRGRLRECTRMDRCQVSPPTCLHLARRRVCASGMHGLADQRTQTAAAGLSQLPDGVTRRRAPMQRLAVLDESDRLAPDVELEHDRHGAATASTCGRGTFRSLNGGGSWPTSTGARNGRPAAASGSATRYSSMKASPIDAGRSAATGGNGRRRRRATRPWSPSSAPQQLLTTDRSAVVPSLFGVAHLRRLGCESYRRSRQAPTCRIVRSPGVTRTSRQQSPGSRRRSR